MDDDALPSSYIMRVLTCVSKWSVKMVGLTDMIASLEKTSDSLTQFHDLICKTFGIPVCAPVCLSVCVEVLCVMLKEQYAGQTQPRLSGRAKDIHAELESLTEKIGNLNASGIMTGFHAAQLRPNLWVKFDCYSLYCKQSDSSFMFFLPSLRQQDELKKLFTASKEKCPVKLQMYSLLWALLVLFLHWCACPEVHLSGDLFLVHTYGSHG